MGDATTLADLTIALREVARTLAVNEPVHRGSWRTRRVSDHICHAVDHLDVAARLAATPDRPVAHVVQELAQAATRVLMALTLAIVVGRRG